MLKDLQGIHSYSKIRFINWKVGIAVRVAMLFGRFIGPKLTEATTLYPAPAIQGGLFYAQGYL
jgi:hypothetical protein